MNELKCPYCGGELQHEHITGVYCCKSSFLSCPVGLGTGAFGTKELWKALVDTREALGDTIKLAEEMLKDIEYEGLCSSYYEEELNKIKSITKGSDNE